jgi:hypothetical protein
MTSETYTAPVATSTANTCVVNTMTCGTGSALHMCTAADCSLADTSATAAATAAAATTNTCTVGSMTCGTGSTLRMCTAADCYTPAPTTTPVNSRRRLEPATKTTSASVTTDARATNTRVISFKSIGLDEYKQ